jgi:hypothetical protein
MEKPSGCWSFEWTPSKDMQDDLPESLGGFSLAKLQPKDGRTCAAAHDTLRSLQGRRGEGGAAPYLRGSTRHAAVLAAELLRRTAHSRVVTLLSSRNVLSPLFPFCTQVLSVSPVFHLPRLSFPIAPDLFLIRLRPAQPLAF